MRRLNRLSLSPATVAFLEKRSAAVGASADPKKEAARLWELKDHRGFREIRAALDQMASGIRRCMYCEDGRGTHIDHFWPKATYPDRAFAWLNYLLACEACNSNYKRDLFPLDAFGRPLLIDPTAEEPLDHLRLTPTTGRFVARSPKGDSSITVFGLDREDLENGRRNAWQGLQSLIVFYGQQRELFKNAAKLEETARRHPFSSVLKALLQISQGPAAADLLYPECRAALARWPEILTWD